MLNIAGIKATGSQIVAHHNRKFSCLEQIQRSMPHLGSHLAIVVEWQVLYILRAQKIANSVNFCPFVAKYQRLFIRVYQLGKFIHVVFFDVEILDLQVSRDFMRLIAFDDCDLRKPVF